MNDPKLMQEFEKFIENKTDLIAFYEALEKCDWFFYLSDDINSYRKGSHAANVLIKWSNKSGNHEALYEAFKSHIFSGDVWNKPQVPKPNKPT